MSETIGVNGATSVLLECWYPRSERSAWAVRCRVLALCLAPLAGVFFLIAELRSRLYRSGFLHGDQLPVPVIVVGNITAGGTGKTPLTLWLAQLLRTAGWCPGIVSRGYRGQGHGVRPVLLESVADQVGDEPILLARQSGCPVWVGARRVDAGRALLAAHPEVDVLLCDDGLQHLSLARDIEIAVIDGARGLGNGHRLPWGPLREGARRLERVTAVVINGENLTALKCAAPTYAMQLQAGVLRNLCDPARTAAVADFVGRPVAALAGIGHPQRFFAQLVRLGLTPVPHAFADHHPFVAADLPRGPVIMTAKDAVKCAAFAHPDCWVLEVDAVVEEGLQGRILKILGLTR